MPLETPVAFIIFNRPDTTAQVFAEIRNAQPRKLLVIADGPRTPEEAQKCESARAGITQVDWDCEVLTNYSDINLGCGKRVSSGITWVFEQVEEAIILEDDCLPDPSFFPFCQQMLTEYRNDPCVMHIGGSNLTPHPEMEASYLFCRLMTIWGWATWRRAWQKYDFKMSSWPEYKKTKNLNSFRTQKEALSETFDIQWQQDVDTWDTQWWFNCLANQGLGIVPKTNLVDNIGFRADATHTPEPNHMSNVPVQGLHFPLVKPSKKAANAKFDEAFLDFCWGKKPNVLISKLKAKMKLRTRLLSIVQVFHKIEAR